MRRTKRTGQRLVWPFVAFAAFIAPGVGTTAFAQPATAVKEKPAAKTAEFPNELVRWSPRPGNPIFAAEGPGHWDVRIRERGWILRDGDHWRLWFTGYDGARDGTKQLGYATSIDGLHWTRWPRNPLVRDHWVEDMCVVRSGGNYYMFAEGANENHAVLLTSKDGVEWKWEGELDVRSADGKRAAPKPCGTPTVWLENDTWYLFYEWLDKGVWLATTRDPLARVWTNKSDEPVLSPGPGQYDKDLLAIDQIMKHNGTYFAYYHGSGSGSAVPRTWNTNIARSTDLVHWQKYSGNPIVGNNKSSGIVVQVAGRLRLYTMHDRIDVFESPRQR